MITCIDCKGAGLLSSGEVVAICICCDGKGMHYLDPHPCITQQINLDPEKCNCGKGDYCPLWYTGNPNPEALIARNLRIKESHDLGR